jgi:C-terminal processing protease CtpA/Prc
MLRQVWILGILLALILDAKFVVKPALAQVLNAQIQQRTLYGNIEETIPPIAPQRLQDRAQRVMLYGNVQAENLPTVMVRLNPEDPELRALKPKDESQSQQFELNADHGQRLWGVLGAQWNQDSGRILRIYEGAICAEVGLRVGDYIVQNSGRPFCGQLEQARDRGIPGTLIYLTVSRNGSLINLVIPRTDVRLLSNFCGYYNMLSDQAQVW